MHEIHVLLDLSNKINKASINFSSFLGYKSAAKRVEDAIDTNRKSVFPNCGMWAKMKVVLTALSRELFAA